VASILAVVSVATSAQAEFAPPLQQAVGNLPRVLALFTQPHGSYTATTGICARCHSSHRGLNVNFLESSPAQSNLCFSCHDGSGANYNIQSQFTDPQVPANDSNTSSFYSHPATTASGHSQARVNEFEGVLDRHSECADCHNPHKATSAAPTATASGWTASGALAGVSGVAVTNGSAGSTPTFTWLSSVTYEYQLCFKCHSSFTNLLSYSKESYKKIDKAKEFNPNNGSFHPIEAQGTNQTTRMANNLSGDSPYKLWTFTTSDVIRCAHCHGDYRKADPASPPAKDARLDPHANKYRSNLMNNYRDRVLRSQGEAYDPADFALCFQCHTTAPYADTSGNKRTDTNFRFHGYHLGKIDGEGSDPSTDIDKPGAGMGNAICAECHYRVHGNPNSTKRLVNFAPNVEPSPMHGGPSWTFSEGNPDTGSCTLKCHGKDHRPKKY
jgi:predicted CXXCH cytochrome family protein